MLKIYVARKRRVKAKIKRWGRKVVNSKGRTTTIIYVKKRQRRVPTSRRGLKLDRAKHKKVLPPGKRISSSGKVYYEYRRNRSDLPGKKI